MPDQVIRERHAVDICIYLLQLEEKIARGNALRTGDIHAVYGCFDPSIRKVAEGQLRGSSSINLETPTAAGLEGYGLRRLDDPSMLPVLYPSISGWIRNGGYSFPPPPAYELWKFQIVPLEKVKEIETPKTTKKRFT